MDCDEMAVAGFTVTVTGTCVAGQENVIGV